VKTIRVLLRDAEGYRWIEDFTIPPITPALKWAQSTVDRFNTTLRPGESVRTVLRVRVIKQHTTNEKMNHEWEKSCLVTQMGKGCSYDTMKCVRCGATGKRYGLGQHGVQPDKEKWRYCRD
jgi:hypothetical protein